MKEKISLASYLFWLENKTTRKIEQLDNINRENKDVFGEKIENDFLKILIDFLNNNKEFSDSINKKDLGVEDVSFEERICFGRVYYGTFGKNWKAKHVETKKTQDMDKYTSPEEPFYYLFLIPKNSNKGVALFEKKGRLEIKETFQRFLYRELVKIELNNLDLKFEEFLPKEVIVEYINKGRIMSLNFLNIPSHNKNQENILNHHLDKVKGEISCYFKIEKGYSDYAKKFMEKLVGVGLDDKNTDFLGIKDMNVNNTIVDVKVGKSRRKFRVDGEATKPFMDITDDIDEDDGGHPKFEDIHGIAKDYAMELMRIFKGGYE
ncbi:hypothetical protein KQY27_00260 [Methanobrevibacter sp. TMH8]|uniref:hypothetical protein n=1 Tax=Methanobrevibacter sp. TMH8 TaxID=2848611 RepID=UPI001CC99505|nr:hypothetical protein [Methanobrevibacter sp. TMH8]MBZ9569991.1 hypothetical protein [Methanobrevibacter sp. TMH8]